MLGPAVTEEAAARTEAELLARVAAGDRGEALAELHRRYAGGLLRLGLRLLGDQGQAEEVVQETFVRVWRGAATYDRSLGAPRAWVFTIARRVAVDMHRRAAARPRGAGDAGLELLAAPEDDVAERLSREAAVREALGGLGPQHREVLELAFHADLATDAIAERLGVPVGTVKSRTFYALRALRARLEEVGVGG